jgi:hypothetical protein
MNRNLDDLTVKFNSDTSNRLTENWTWLIGSDKKVLLVTIIGDMFVMDKSKRVYWLDVGTGEFKLVADCIDDFEEKLKNVEQVNEWFMIELATALRHSHNKLKDGQLYSYKMLPIIGGEYSPDNFAPLDIIEHFGYTGAIHKQIKDLPDGTKVEIKIVD